MARTPQTMRNPIHHAPASARLPLFGDVLPASVAERRVMKKVAQPEHAYTGCLPQGEEQDDKPLPVRRNTPILGYKGYLGNADDRIGTTFTNGLKTAAMRAPEAAAELPRRGHARDSRQQGKSNNIQQAPAHRVHFQPQELRQHGHHHQQQQYDRERPRPAQERMGPGSGYGAFDGASGYGEFQAPPPAQMSARSGYGAFDGASGYGEFQAPPPAQMSARSGYGAFDGASGYGEFQAPPSVKQRVSFVQQKPQQHQHQQQQQPNAVNQTSSSHRLELKLSESLDQKYQQALKSVGGKANALKLWNAAATSISSRYRKRTELLQAIKRCFEKSESENAGNMTKKHLSESLQTLACVFTDDQITALFGIYDVHCTGEVPMDTLLFALTDCL